MPPSQKQANYNSCKLKMWAYDKNGKRYSACLYGEAFARKNLAETRRRVLASQKSGGWAWYVYKDKNGKTHRIKRIADGNGVAIPFINFTGV